MLAVVSQQAKLRDWELQVKTIGNIAQVQARPQARFSNT